MSFTGQLQRRLQKFFETSIKDRGEEYFRYQAVQNVQLSEWGAVAEVVGTKIYTTALQWKDISTGQIKIYCSCPHYTEGTNCKHLWAVILKLDKTASVPHHLFYRNIEFTLADSMDHFYSSNEEEALEDITSYSPQKVNWKNAFHNIKQQNKKSTPLRQDVYIVMDKNSSDDRVVQFKFYALDKNTTETTGYIRPFIVPIDGNVKNVDVQMESLLKTISTLSNEDSLKNSFYNQRTQADLTQRRMDLRLLRPILPGLLDSHRIFAKKEDITIDKINAQDSFLKKVDFKNLILKAQPNEKNYLLSAQIEVHIGGKKIAVAPLQNLSSLARPHLFALDNYIGFLEILDAEKSWYNELSKNDIPVAEEEVEPFLEALLNQNIPFDLPESLNWKQITLAPTPHIKLRSDKRPQKQQYIVDIEFKYNSRRVNYRDNIDKVPSLTDKTVYLRNTTIEDALVLTLPLDLLSSEHKKSEELTLNIKNVTDFVKQTLASGVPITVEGRPIQQASDVKITVTSGLDWFDVSAAVDFSGRWIKLPSLLAAIQKGEIFVPLADGSMGVIDEKLTQRIDKLSLLGNTTGDHFRFSQSQGLLLSSILENEVHIDADEKFKSLKKKIDSFSGIKSVEPSPGFKGKLRQYQKEGLAWLHFLNEFGLGGILADDMGLGKTIQCLAFLENRITKNKKSLCSLLVAPKSLLDNWQQESSIFTPKIRTLIYSGSQRTRSELSFKSYDLVIMTYQTLLRDIETLKEIKWDCVIADEAQAMKNPNALVSRSIKELQAQFRLAMTGTPIENSVQDLFSISDFVNPGFLNGKKRNSNLKVDAEFSKVLSQAFKPVVLRRTKDQVLKDLPSKTEQTIVVELEEQQLKIYNQLKKFYQTQLMKTVEEKGIKKSQIQILAALTRLRQVALHPALVDPTLVDCTSAKFEVVLEMLDQVIKDKHRVLIFSQFTKLLDLLKAPLEQRKIDYCYLDGKTQNRKEVVASFKDSLCPVFLMSLKAGGVGLNLVEADYVFLLDPWWNPAVEAQAIDRVHRIGQKKAVNAYRFIAKNTVEEKILALQKTKLNISDSLIGKESSPIRSLTALDIENIFS